MKFIAGILFFTVMVLSVSATFAEDGKILVPLSKNSTSVGNDAGKVVYPGYHSLPSQRNLLNLERDLPWTLPRKSSTVAAKGVDTLRLLGLRFDFKGEESVDDPLTTGNGKFDFRSFDDFVADYKHEVDPSPHNRSYFESHFRALRNYYFFVSGGTLEMVWDVYPQAENEVYHLNRSMSYYGAGTAPQSGDSIGKYLTQYFIDCFQLVDTTDPSVIFGNYDSYFIFHAGSDRQNDLGFPETPGDLYTGYIFFIDPATGLPDPGLLVDGGLTPIVDALIMPEMASQDNRAVALNAVIAHEFGHQLGLVDLYRTDYMSTRVGDFALMDNNGFGTSIDFGFEAGGAFGTIPVYPTAWSRAFLGFDSVHVFQEGTAIELAAAEMTTLGTKIARIPISEREYYLLENRQVDIDGLPTYMLADSITSVFQGPVNLSKQFTGEYDFLLPGSGMLIWHVDEAVAALDYNGIRGNNFLDNQLQNDPRRPFMELMEADGQVNFGGDYYSGFGTQEDMYYADNNSSFTPNSNPSSFGYGNVNTHIYVTDISASDKTMTFNLENDFYSDGFPGRAGLPVYSLSPIAADIDDDDTTEIIVPSGNNLLVINAEDGSDYTPTYTAGQVVYDTAYSSYSSIDSSLTRRYALPLFARTPGNISAGPIFGTFYHNSDSTRYIAVAVDSMVYFYTIYDNDFDGLGDTIGTISLPPYVIWLSGGDDLNAMVWDYKSNPIFIQLFDISYDGVSLSAAAVSPHVEERQPYGLVRLENGYLLLAGDAPDDIDPFIELYYITDVTHDSAAGLDGFYQYGPVATDLDRDGQVEVIVMTPEGEVKVVSLDTTQLSFSVYKTNSLDDDIIANPIVADLDNDGFPEIIVGGKGRVHALDKNLVTVSGFPMTIDRKFDTCKVIAPPVVGDINYDHIKDIIVINSMGLCYALSSSYTYNEQLLYGFPVTAGFALDDMGGEAASPVIFKKSNGGGFGLLGSDGWFYSFDVGYDSTSMDWPMNGGSANATNYLPESKLGTAKINATRLPEDQFYCYPNPTRDGSTTIRYYLGADADVTLTFYDMSGQRVSEPISFRAGGGLTDEYDWDGSLLTTGVYRCVIEAEFSDGEKQSTFTDIAVIK